MRVLVTLDFPPERGGIQRHLAGIVSHTFAKGDAVLVGGARVPNAAAQIYPCPITYCSTILSRFNKKWSIVPLAWRCLKLVRVHGCSLSIECGNVYAALAPWVVSLVKPLRYRVYVHGTECIGLSHATIKNRLLKRVLARADTIIANSAYTAVLVGDQMPEKQIDVATPKIERVEPFQRRRVSGDHARSDAFSILSVGRLVPHKGHNVLLKAVSLLPKEMNWNLVVVGNGPLLAALKQCCGELGIADRATLKTDLTDHELDEEYQKASIFALPSIAKGGTEGFGIVLLEAMAHCCAIVASDIGGVAEVLDNGSCGVLIKPGSAEELCEALKRLAADRALRQSLVSSGMERLLKRYVWQ